MTWLGTRSSAAAIPTARSCSHARRTHGESAESAPRRVLDFGGYAAEVGMRDWAAPMVWMSEPAVLAHTGLTVEDPHPRRAVALFRELRERGPELRTSQFPRRRTCKSGMQAPIRLRTTTLGRLTP